MSERKNIIAFIPARGGSKGIIGKNIIDLGGRPLIQWTIQAALNTSLIDTIIVNSDCDKILFTLLNNNRSKAFVFESFKIPLLLPTKRAAGYSFKLLYS